MGDSSIAEPRLRFYAHPQSEAIATFLPTLEPHLPVSNALYNRVRAPHNLPSRHCLFAATFPPNSKPMVPETHTILFADRSRHSESQIWIFNSLVTQPELSAANQAILRSHLTAAILFLKRIEIPEAPGWPFSPILRFACLHEYFSSQLRKIAEPTDALVRATYWNVWNIRISSVRRVRPLPQGFTFARVSEDQLDPVLATSTIPRQASTMLMLPNVGILHQGRLVAWAYIGIDGALITLHVLPEYRGRGLAIMVAAKLLEDLAGGDFKEMGFDGSSGWVHADVEAGNVASEKVMMSLGGKVRWVSSYTWIDSEKF